MSPTGQNLLNVLSSLESRATVLEHELREIDMDMAANATMGRKYGDEHFAEGAAMLAHTRREKAERLADIQHQLADTGRSVQMGKELLGTLGDNTYLYAGRTTMLPPTAAAAQGMDPPPPVIYDDPPPPRSPAKAEASSAARILTSSPILAHGRARRG